MPLLTLPPPNRTRRRRAVVPRVPLRCRGADRGHRASLRGSPGLALRCGLHPKRAGVPSSHGTLLEPDSAGARLDEQRVRDGGTRSAGRARPPTARSEVPSAAQRRRAVFTVDRGGKLSGSMRHCRRRPFPGRRLQSCVNLSSPFGASLTALGAYCSFQSLRMPSSRRPSGTLPGWLTARSRFVPPVVRPQRTSWLPLRPGRIVPSSARRRLVTV
jgi:hypothetical protein